MIFGMRFLWISVCIWLFRQEVFIDSLCLENENPTFANCTCNNITGTIVCMSTENTTYANITDAMLIGIKSLTIRAGSKEIFIALGALQEVHDTVAYIDIEHTEGVVILDRFMFGRFPNVKHVRIHHCGVHGIIPNAFMDNPNVEVLDLSGNSYLMFENLTQSLQNASISNLKVLNISGIHTIFPPAVISNLFCNALRRSKLEILDISWILLREINCSFTGLPHFRVLNASGTDIDGTKECISTLIFHPNLETVVFDHWPTISMEYEGIAYTPESEYIQKKDVSETESNSIKKRETKETATGDVVKRETGEECVFILPLNLTTGCFLQPKTITTIYLRHTDFKRLHSFDKETCFQDSELINLILTGVKSTNSLQPFKGLHFLKFIDIAYPKPSFDGLPFVPTMFQDMPSLEIIIVPGARLSLLQSHQLVGLIKNNLRLRIIDLSDNNIGNIPSDMFVVHLNLEILNISRNKLSDINIDFTKNNKLREIDLRYNVFDEIHDAFIKSILTLNVSGDHRLLMNGNILKCNCNLLKIAQLQHVTTVASCFHEGQLFDLSTIATSYLAVYPDLEEVCREETASAPVIGYAIGGTLGLISIIVIMIVVLLCRRGICFQKRNPTWIVTLEQTQRKREPTFIVFLAYCSTDSEFVLQYLYPKLEDKLRGMLQEHDANKLIVIHDKHFLPGMPISDIICEAIEGSYVTVAVISDQFVNSAWCDFEVKTAYTTKVPIIPLYISKVDRTQLGGIFKLLYDTKVRLVWPNEHPSDKTQQAKAENKVLDTLCANIKVYVEMISKAQKDDDAAEEFEF